MLVFNLSDIVKNNVCCEKYSVKRGECTSNAAFPDTDTLTVRVRVPRALCAKSAYMELYRDDDMSTRDVTAQLVEFGDADDVFAVTLTLSDICIGEHGGLFYYTFGLDTSYGVLYISRDGRITAERSAVSCEQLTVYTDDMIVPEKFRGSMMYQIFVDRFFDGGAPISPDEGKVYNHDWENGVPQYAEKPGDPLANNEFFGGNLYGVADKLDYIASLGVDTLYLCPIFEAASNHKYDTGDYMKIDRMFGGEEAFDRLVRELKARGMRLILDGVFNHTGADSRYFNKFGRYAGAGAYNSKRSKYYRWYTFDEYPDEYRCWWGIKILPAVNGTDESWREFICGEKGVIRHYLKRGIDGWRLDVADELSDTFLDALKSAARDENPDALVIGEVWEDASNKIAYDKRRRYFRGGQLDSVMNYPLKEAVIDYVLGGDSARLEMTARELWAHYPEAVSHATMNFLGTHDTERILTVLAGVGTRGMTNREIASFRLNKMQRRAAISRLKLAWTLLCAFPGMPCIYYGDEVGMEGGRDPFNRMPYVWGREDTGLRAFYQKIGSIRKNEPLFAYGDLKIIDTGDASQFMLTREYDGRKLAAAVNLSERPWDIEFEAAPKRLIGNGRCDNTVTLAPNTAEYFVL